MRLWVERLTVAKGGRAVLADVTAEFPSGRLSVVIGPNGAGKSSLLRAIAGLDAVAPVSRIILGERDLSPNAAHERAKDIAWSPAASDAPFAYEMLDAVVMGRFPWHRGAPSSKDVAAAERALLSVGLGPSFHRRTLPSLSSGERMKVMVARALASESACLLFDEPTANLDIGAAFRLMALFKAEAARGRTVIVALHDLPLACRAADHAVCLTAGRLAALGQPAQVFSAAVLNQIFAVKAAPVRTPGGEASLLFDS